MTDSFVSEASVFVSNVAKVHSKKRSLCFSRYVRESNRRTGTGTHELVIGYHFDIQVHNAGSSSQAVDEIVSNDFL